MKRLPHQMHCLSVVKIVALLVALVIVLLVEAGTFVTGEILV